MIHFVCKMSKHYIKHILVEEMAGIPKISQHIKALNGKTFRGYNCLKSQERDPNSEGQKKRAELEYVYLPMPTW